MSGVILALCIVLGIIATGGFTLGVILLIYAIKEDRREKQPGLSVKVTELGSKIAKSDDPLEDYRKWKEEQKRISAKEGKVISKNRHISRTSNSNKANRQVNKDNKMEKQKELEF